MVKLRLDRFTVAVLIVVGLLLAAAVITVNRSGNTALQEYRSDDAPETPVVNAFLALQQGDLATARRQYSEAVLARAEDDKSYGPLNGQTYYPSDSSRRLRLVETRIDPQDSNIAYVTAAVDNYSTGGIFNGGSTWTSERVVEVVREEGVWKINVDEFFY